MAQHGSSAPHPRRDPRFPFPLTQENLAAAFSDCADFCAHRVRLDGGRGREVGVCFVAGMARTERLNDYILRPLAGAEGLSDLSPEELSRRLVHGALWAQPVLPLKELDRAVEAAIDGSCILFPGGTGALAVPVPTEEKRAVSDTDSEPALKGSRESFVESVRTNTSLVRRRLRTPGLKVVRHIVGRQSLTPVEVVWLEGLADPAVVGRVRSRLEEMDIDGIQEAGALEEYLADPSDTPFPLTFHTRRPDRFCQGLQEGRVGVLCDGLPQGYLLPATAELFFRTGQDRSLNWMAASALSCLRYLCAAITVVLPGLYAALVTYHPEAIPVKLALSIVAAKQEVPFTTVFEVITMLLAFEVLQEAGLRLPVPIGATVSILGGLVVGNAAVEARIVSPAVLIAVAMAGIAGYTQPDQDFAGALRLWRFLLALLASLAGLFGLSIGCILLIHHLAGLETFSTPYLAPFTSGTGRGRGGPDLTRPPLKRLKWRPLVGRGRNRRNQR